MPFRRFPINATGAQNISVRLALTNHPNNVSPFVGGSNG
jgi:hypothetical protein